MAQALPVMLSAEDADEPRGAMTPSEVYRALDERGRLAHFGTSRQTVRNRVRRLAPVERPETEYEAGSDEFVSDPRERVREE